MHNFGGGRSDLFNSGVKRAGGSDIFKIQGGVGLKGELKNSGGVWTLDEAMVLANESAIKNKK